MNIKTSHKIEQNAKIAANLLKTLGNEQRLLILCQLLQGEKNVGELGAQLTLSQSALSQHLKLLREAKIVATRKEAQTVYYRIADNKIEQVLIALQKTYCQ